MDQIIDRTILSNLNILHEALKKRRQLTTRDIGFSSILVLEKRGYLECLNRDSREGNEPFRWRITQLGAVEIREAYRYEAMLNEMNLENLIGWNIELLTYIEENGYPPLNLKNSESNAIKRLKDEDMLIEKRTNSGVNYKLTPRCLFYLEQLKTNESEE